MTFPIYYDFRVAPLSFDFAVFLAIGSAEARRHGSKHVDLWLIRSHFRRNNQIEDTYAREYDQWKFNNVVLKLASFTNTIRNTFIIRGGQFEIPKQRKYPPNYDPSAVDLKSPSSQIPTNFIHLHPYYKLGFVPFIFDAKTYVKDFIKKKYPLFDTTLTLRTAIQKPHRNIDLSEWYELYKILEENGRSVLVIPDHDDYYAEKNYKKFDWTYCEEAAADLEMRLACYQTATRNISWACGMYTLMFFGNTNFLIFGKYDEGEQTSSKNFISRKGPIFQEQFPWAKDRLQHIDWTERSDLTLKKMIELSLWHVAE
tara:strand:+ start:1256 stop:2194 length:939 start_codon:yes stop_codon:yes gene_type:complete